MEILLKPKQTTEFLKRFKARNKSFRNTTMLKMLFPRTAAHCFCSEAEYDNNEDFCLKEVVNQVSKYRYHRTLGLIPCMGN